MKYRKSIREVKDIGGKSMAGGLRTIKNFYKYLRNRRKMTICRVALFTWR